MLMRVSSLRRRRRRRSTLAALAMLRSGSTRRRRHRRHRCCYVPATARAASTCSSGNCNGHGLILLCDAADAIPGAKRRRLETWAARTSSEALDRRRHWGAAATRGCRWPPSSPAALGLAAARAAGGVSSAASSIAGGVGSAAGAVGPAAADAAAGAGRPRCCWCCWRVFARPASSAVDTVGSAVGALSGDLRRRHGGSTASRFAAGSLRAARSGQPPRAPPAPFAAPPRQGRCCGRRLCRDRGDVSSAAGTVGESAASARDTATEQGQHLRTVGPSSPATSRTAPTADQEQPLAVAATGTAIGAAIAAALPRSRTEDSSWARPATNSRTAPCPPRAAQRAKDASGRVVEEVARWPRRRAIPPPPPPEGFGTSARRWTRRDRGGARMTR